MDWMELFPKAIGVLALVITLGVTMWRRRTRSNEKYMDKDHFIIRAPIVALRLGILICAFSMGCGAILAAAVIKFDEGVSPWIVLPGVIPLVLGGVFLILVGINRKAELDGDILTVTNFLGKKKNYDFSRTRVDWDPFPGLVPRKQAAVYAGKRRLFVVEEGQPGYKFLMERLGNLEEEWAQ